MSDLLTRLLFEDLPLLMLAELLAVAVALAVHRRWYTLRTRRAVWITFGTCIALLALQELVQTDRERIKQLLRELAAAVDEGDTGAIAQRLDEQFKDYQARGSEEFLALANSTLQRFQVDQAEVWKFAKLRIEGDTAAAEVQALCDLRSANYTQYRLPSRWEVHLIRRSKEWKVSYLRPIQIGQYSAKQLEGWLDG